MTTYTEAQLATRVLKDLGLIGAEETPSAADLAWAIETCHSEAGALAAIGIPLWNGSTYSVPDQYFTTLSRRVGLALAPSFGVTDPASAQSAMREAERTLTIMAAPRNAPLPLRTDLPVRGGFNFSTGQ